MNDLTTKAVQAGEAPAPPETAEPSAEAREHGALRRGTAAATPEDVVRRVTEIAFSRPNDALALACGQRGRVEEMDLAAVAEFKCKDEMGEVKFVDRLRALELLWELLGGSGGGESAARDFLLALDRRGGGEEVRSDQ